MSSRATYNVPYDMNDRELRKKAFIKKRKRKRFIITVAFLAVIALLLIMGIVGLVNLIKNKVAERELLMTYVDCRPEDDNVVLVDNSLVGRSGTGAFFELDETDPEKDLSGEAEVITDPKAEKYKDIVPGSKGLVIVDAGHGGYDGGAEANGLLEKEVNLDIAFKLKAELELRGYSVAMTRTEDIFVGLTQRASIANSLNDPLCLISIHQNSLEASEGSANGMESWTYDREGCEELGDAIVDATASKTGARNRGTHFRKNLVVTSKTTMPAIIFECGYLTDAGEAEKLGDSGYREIMVEGIVDGVDDFCTNYYGR